MKEINYLKEKIRKTGYPLEIEISSMLDRKWVVVNTDAYLDSDEGKMRDIDITAWQYSPKTWLPIMVEIGLIIECKKDDNFAWVFFTRPLEFNWGGDIDGQYLDEIQILTKNVEATQIEEIISKKTKLHYASAERVAVAFDEFFMKGKKKTFEKKRREIFEAENQLKKYISYYFGQWGKARYDIYRLNMFFPLIVFDGNMYETIIEKGKIKVSETKHVVLTTSYRTSYSIWEQNLLIDVVHKDYFREFLKVLGEDIKSFKRVVRGNKKRIEREVERATSLLGTAKK